MKGVCSIAIAVLGKSYIWPSMGGAAMPHDALLVVGFKGG